MHMYAASLIWSTFETSAWITADLQLTKFSQHLVLHYKVGPMNTSCWMSNISTLPVTILYILSGPMQRVQIIKCKIITTNNNKLVFTWS